MNGGGKYLGEQFTQHVARFFTAEANRSVQITKILFGPFRDMTSLREKAIAIPTDLPSSIIPHDIFKFPFNGTQVTLWNKLPRPDGSKWDCFPNEETPVWYQHEEGAVLPAWNLFGNVFGLITFREEMEIPARDCHGRFIAAMSPRFQAGLLEVPAFNEAVALIVAACNGLEKENRPGFDLGKRVKAPAIILSHDVDILQGNDLWTQGARLYRMFAPIASRKTPEWANLKWIADNFIHPRRYYLDDIIRLIEAESIHGARSSFYLLNGSGGRFGARNGTSLLSEALRNIPDEWNTGIHYNYDTFLSPDRFEKQISELTDLLGKRPISGRAHYLRFDPRETFRFLAGRGILCDETAGFPDQIGYRCGIAGPFQPFDEAWKQAIPIWEIPLVIMEGTLIDQYQEQAIKAFSRMLDHLSKVGGALSVLFHPGLYCNPEFPRAWGLYDKILAAGAEAQTTGVSSRDLMIG
jgi:hypothetical protein